MHRNIDKYNDKKIRNMRQKTVMRLIAGCVAASMVSVAASCRTARKNESMRQSVAAESVAANVRTLLVRDTLYSRMAWEADSVTVDSIGAPVAAGAPPVSGRGTVGLYGVRIYGPRGDTHTERKREAAVRDTASGRSRAGMRTEAVSQTATRSGPGAGSLELALLALQTLILVIALLRLRRAPAPSSGAS